MSIPTTETRPDGLQSLPPRQRRSIRKRIETASSLDKHNLVWEIARHALPNISYYLQLLICALLLTVGVLASSNLILLAGIIAMPMTKPLLSLIYAGALPSAKHFWHALISLFVTLGVLFLAGWLIRDMTPVQAENLLFGVGKSNGTEAGLLWATLIITAALTAYWFTYSETLSRLSSILLGYLVLLPFFDAGLSASAGFAAGSLPLLGVGLTRLGLALLVMFLTTWVLGFPPRRSFGVFVAVLIFALATVSMTEIIHREQNPFQAQTPEPAVLVVPTSTAVPPTPTTPAPTATLVPSPTTEPTSSPEPTATVPAYISARVTAPNGLIIREAPSTSAYILAYANHDEIVWLTGVKETNQGITWDQVVAPIGVIGWVSTQFLEVINP